MRHRGESSGREGIIITLTHLAETSFHLVEIVLRRKSTVYITITLYKRIYQEGKIGLFVNIFESAY